VAAAPVKRAIVVPGQGTLGTDGAYRITPACHRLIDHAARLANVLDPALVVVSGWSPSGGESEAAQMAAAWPGRTDVEVVAEKTAANTAENMARTLPLLEARGITEATVVCLPLHRLRVAYFFRGVYPRFGIAARVSSPRVAPTLGALGWEAVALSVVRRQRRAALAELEGRVPTPGG